MRMFKTAFTAALMFAALNVCVPVCAMTQNEFLEICRNGDALQLAAALKDEGASVTKADGKGNTPLMIVVQARGTEVDLQKVRLLINAGSNVNAQNKESMRVLMLAAQKSDSPAVIAELVNAGAELEERSTRGWTPLAFAAARNPDPAIANALFDLGADINATENTEATPLALALRAGNTYAVVSALLDNGAALTAPNAKKTQTQAPDPKKYTEAQLTEIKERLKQTPQLVAATPERFAQACRYGIPQRINLFLKARTDPNAVFDGLTPLMYAAESNVHPGVITMLLQWGAHENERDERGSTALIKAAASNRNSAALTELLTAGARADYRDIEGKDALDYARANTAYRPEDLQLLSSIAITVQEAEKRGAELELERQKAEQLAATDVRQLTDLYRKLAKNQTEVLRLTENTADLRKQLDHALQTAGTAQKLEQRGQLQLDEQKRLVEKLTRECENLRDSQQKDRESLRSITDKLTSLWQTELQKNLKLVKETSLVTQQRENEIKDLSQQLQTSRDENQQLALAQVENENRHQSELNAAKELSEAEKAILESSLNREIEELKRELEQQKTEHRQALEWQNSAVSQHKQEILSLKAQQSRLLENSALKNQQYVADLTAQHNKELQDLRAQAEKQRLDELKKLDAQWQQKKDAEIVALRTEHVMELTKQQKDLEGDFQNRLAELAREKDEETRKKLEAAEAESFNLKAQFDETVASMREAVDRSIASAQEKETSIEELKATFLSEKAALEKQLSDEKAHADEELQKRLATQETQLRAEFEVEKARLDASSHQDLLNTATRLESGYVDKLNEIKKQHQEDLEEQISQLQAALDEARAQAASERERADKAEAELRATEDKKRSDDINTGIEQGRSEARRIFESAYAASIRQTEARYDRMLKEQQTRLQMEHSAELETLSAKHQQEFQKVTLEAVQQRERLLTEQRLENEQKITDLRAEWNAQASSREQELIAQHQEEIQRLKSDYEESTARLAASLKQEYLHQLEKFISFRHFLNSTANRNS